MQFQVRRQEPDRRLQGGAQKPQRLSNAWVPRLACNIRVPWEIINKICLKPQSDSELLKMMPQISEVVQVIFNHGQFGSHLPTSNVSFTDM